MIYVDLNDGSYCNGTYRGASNMRVSTETGFDEKECRFNFFAAGDIAAGEDIIYSYRAFEISSGWAEFGL